MKHLNTITIILLNVIFCILTLWLFSKNSILRPYAGSSFKEFIAGLLLLGTVYVNYFLLYPSLYQKHSHIIYWLTLVLTVLLTGGLDLIIAYPNIVLCSAPIIEMVGPFSYFSKILFFLVGRNMALNFFPFLLRDRKRFQQSLEKEVRVVYQDVRKIDVEDSEHNILLVPIDDIFYCLQDGNYAYIYLVQNKHYTRYGSMKHLAQLLGDDFIRITATTLLPFRHIKACKDNVVIMKKMPWQEEAITFRLESQNQEQIEEIVAEGIMRYRVQAGKKKAPKKTAHRDMKRKPILPPKDAVETVFSCIQKHPDCKSADIVAKTSHSLSTVERCLSELRKQERITYVGSKKTGGYRVVNTQPDGNAAEPAQNEGNITGEKVTEEKSAKKKLNEEKKRRTVI